LLVASLYPVLRLGGEFMPPLDEGDLLYMPSALPGLSAGKAAEVLQQTDRLIPNRARGGTRVRKAGRAETATDPAPMEMFELHPVQAPGSVASGDDDGEADRGVGWDREGPRSVQHLGAAIRNRIDMLATGIKSPLGIKVAGANLAETERVAQDIERVVKDIPGVTSALAERLTGGGISTSRSTATRRRATG